MNGQDSKAEIFDVFLCHNDVDKPAVREIAQKLKKEGIKPWLDEEQIRPGISWETMLGQQIESIKSAAIFVGDGGLGPWQNQEMQSFLNRFLSRKCAVIPVILPSAKAKPELPLLLASLHRVDFRSIQIPSNDSFGQLLERCRRTQQIMIRFPPREQHHLPPRRLPGSVFSFAIGATIVPATLGDFSML